MKSQSDKIDHLTDRVKEMSSSLRKAHKMMDSGIEKASKFKYWIQNEVYSTPQRDTWKNESFRKGYVYAMIQVMKKMKIEREG